MSKGSGGRQQWSGRWLRLAGNYLGMGLVLVTMTVFFSFQCPHFFAERTFLAIFNEMIPVITIVSVGMTFVLIIAQIDLSVGSVLSLSGAVMGLCMTRSAMPLWAAVCACLAVGLACGLLNGGLTIKWRLPSFIVTLGMLEMARGGAYLVTGSQTQYIGKSVAGIAAVSIGGLSLSFLLAVAIVIIGQLVLSYTILGRYMIAIGTNEEAVRLSGIDTRWVKLTVFVICGTLSALAGLITTSQFQAADPNAGGGMELQAIAAVVIGGTSLMGGRGSVVSSFFGVLIIAVLGTGLTQMGAGEPTKRLITGLVIIAAVIVDYYRHKLTIKASK